MDLEQIGWNPFFVEAWESSAAEGQVPGRIAGARRGFFTLWTQQGEIEAQARGGLVREADADLRPVVGDWVVLTGEPLRVERVLPRFSKVSRKRPGEATREQVLAANVDVLFIVAGLDRDFNPRRLERYVSLVADSGAQPVLVLNKTDLCEDVPAAVAAAEAASAGAPVLAACAAEDSGVEALAEHLSIGRTGAFLGSSGVGKSALVNRLLGREERLVGAVRESDGRGRHTSVTRALIALPAGGMLLDMPGLREVQPWEEASVVEAFDDVEALAAECRFRDCSHHAEPGCRVREAVEAGELDASRLASYRSLRQEAAALERRKQEREVIDEKRAPRRRQNTSRRAPKRK